MAGSSTATFDFSTRKTRVNANNTMSRIPVTSTGCEVALLASMSTTATGTLQLRNKLGGLYGTCNAQATVR